jgi:hypothetical protein
MLKSNVVVQKPTLILKYICIYALYPTLRTELDRIFPLNMQNKGIQNLYTPFVRTKLRPKPSLLLPLIRD